MSQDEILFDDVKYREPERRLRPDRDRRWACIAYETPGPNDLPIYLDRLTADVIERHALRDTSVELGGILLGKECVDEETGEPFVWVTQSLEAKHYENTQASFTYTHDSWEEITRERDRLHPDLDIVGWYHTHPDFGIFLSSHDQFIHKNFFDQPLQVAYVVDPIRQTRGFFQWRDGQLDQVSGFFVSADRHDRIALSRLVNDLENIPNTEGGGALSPRLEAELIAMLTRPPLPHTMPADRSVTAVLFAMLGVALGMIACAAAWWLNSLNANIMAQSDALRELNRTVRESSESARAAFDVALNTESDSTGDRLSQSYTRLLHERDAAQKKVNEQRLINEALAGKSEELKKDLETARSAVADYKKEAEENAKVLKEAKELREGHKKLSERVAILEPRSEELSRYLETAEGRKHAEFHQSYNQTWWAMVIGWGLTVLLAVGLLAVVGGNRFLPEPEKPPEPKPDFNPPTHHIT